MIRGIDKRFVFVTGIILLFALLRLVIQIPNVSPVAAIALFGGSMISRRSWSIIIPIAVLLVSDLFLGFYSLPLMLSVYGSMVLIALIGRQILKQRNIRNLVLASIVSSLSFFIITNFVVWAEGIWYPMNITGLVSCFTAAIPFLRFELIGTLAFSIIFFSAYYLVDKYTTLFVRAKA